MTYNVRALLANAPFSNKTRSSECLGWSRSQTGRFVDSIDKRLVTGTGIPPRELNNPAGAALADITGVEGPNEIEDEVE